MKRMKEKMEEEEEEVNNREGRTWKKKVEEQDIKSITERKRDKDKKTDEKGRSRRWRKKKGIRKDGG